MYRGHSLGFRTANDCPYNVKPGLCRRDDHWSSFSTSLCKMDRSCTVGVDMIRLFSVCYAVTVGDKILAHRVP